MTEREAAPPPSRSKFLNPKPVVSGESWVLGNFEKGVKDIAANAEVGAAVVLPLVPL